MMIDLPHHIKISNTAVSAKRINIGPKETDSAILPEIDNSL